jgi:hypothetical protein
MITRKPLHCSLVRAIFYFYSYFHKGITAIHRKTFSLISVEQVKGSEEMKEKIIAASKDARSLPDYPQELLPDYFTNSATICDKYLNNYQESHLQTNGN